MRYSIVGTSGSGKSTLARAIADRCGIAHIELDNLFWEPHWQKAPLHVFIDRVVQATQSDDWVSCGNHSRAQPLLLAQADKIIWLDYPFWMIFWRVIKRTARRIWRREPCCHGNYETVYRQFFTKDSIFLWVIRTYLKRKQTYSALMQGPDKEKWIRITNAQELQIFLDGLS